jgi:pyridoxal phosphate enzyme (YggS family)
MNINNSIKYNIDNLIIKIKDLSKSLNNNVPINIIAVSKTKPIEDIKTAYNCGIKDFGENYIQEALEKSEILKELHINWHFIGSVQTNKVKYLIKFCYLLHSLDRVSLADALQKRLQFENKKMNCIIQVNTSGESTKSGISPQEFDDFTNYVSKLYRLNIVGLMTVAENSEDKNAIRQNFKQLKNLFEEVKNKNYPNFNMQYLSMGMSGDYDIAIEEGSNMLRIGSTIFGARNYEK